MCVLVQFWLLSWKQALKISDQLVLKNGWADLFHVWVVDSAQFGYARSVIKEAKLL